MMFLSVLLLAGRAAGSWISCDSYRQIGEIRSYDMPTNYMCLHAQDGVGKLQWDSCKGLDMQRWALCGDGSLRNIVNNHCAVAEYKNGGLSGDVTMQPCPFDGNNNLHTQARWRLGMETAWTDKMGIQQVLFMIVHESTWALGQDRWGVLTYKVGSGDAPQGFSRDVRVWSNLNLNNQYWYYDNRGGVKAFGRIENKMRPKQVFETEWHTNTQQSYSIWQVDVESPRNDGYGRTRQAWTWYESGEIVSMFNRKCLNAAGQNHDGALVGGSCGKVDWQQWTDQMQPKGEYMTLVPVAKLGDVDVQCIAPQPNEPGQKLDMMPCTWEEQQYWKWNENVDFSKPDIKWTLVTCNDSGAPEYAVSASTEYGEEVSEEVAIGIEMSITAGCEFYEASLSESITTTLGNTWSHSYSSTQTVTAKCQYWPDGTPIQRACLWQMDMSMEYDGKDLSWTPIITTCTPGAETPKCPPFEMCADDACGRCIPMGGAGRATNHGAYMERGFKGFGEKEGQNPKPRAMKLGETAEKETVAAALLDGEKALNFQHLETEDHRHFEKCGVLSSDLEGCRARRDCKPIMRRDVIKKCKPIKCKKLTDRFTCMTAASKCSVRRTIGRKVQCGKAKRKD